MRPLFVVLNAIVVVVVFAGGAAAHTEVQRAEPSPGEVVSGSVDSVDLVFLDPVLPSVVISVSTADGGPVAGLEDVEHTGEGRRASVRFDPITEPGAYIVDYEFVAVDGDAQSDAYRFTIESDGDGASVLGRVVAVLVVVGGLAGLGLALRRRDRGHG